MGDDTGDLKEEGERPMSHFIVFSCMVIRTAELSVRRYVRSASRRPFLDASMSVLPTVMNQAGTYLRNVKTTFYIFYSMLISDIAKANDSL